MYFFEANTDCPAGVLGQVFSSQDEQGLKQFIESADVFSLEFENTPVADVDVLTQTKTLHPPRIALATAQNRLSEKALFDELAIPVAPYRAVDSLESLKKLLLSLVYQLYLRLQLAGMTVKVSLYFVLKTKLIQLGQSLVLQKLSG